MNYKFLLLFLVCIISLFHCVPRVLGSPIVGGFIARRHKYHVSFHKINSGTRTYEYFCGGTIIHEKYILTVANLFMLKLSGRVVSSMNLARERPKIIAGTNERQGPGIEQYIVTIFIPKDYEYYPRKGDIAVAQLRDNLGVAHNIKTLAIMPLGELPPNEANERASFCGFGYYHLERRSNGNLYYLPIYSELKLYLPVTLLDGSRCPRSQICAVASDTSVIRAGCVGDDGAGLISGNRIVGVYYKGPVECDSNTIPMQFMRLSLFTREIERAMNERADRSDMHVLV